MSISRAKRATTSGLSASAGARNFSATIAPSGARRAVDGPHAAAAQARFDAIAADLGSGAIDLGNEARAAGDRARARDVDLRRAGRTGDDRVCIRGERRVASGAEQVQRRGFHSNASPVKACLRSCRRARRRGRRRQPKSRAETRGFARAPAGGTAVAKRAVPCRFPSTSLLAVSLVLVLVRRRRGARRHPRCAARETAVVIDTRAHQMHLCAARQGRPHVRRRARHARRRQAAPGRQPDAARPLRAGPAARVEELPHLRPRRLPDAGAGAPGIHGQRDRHPRSAARLFDAGASWRCWSRRTGRPAASPSPPTTRSRPSPPGCASRR